MAGKIRWTLDVEAEETAPLTDAERAQIHTMLGVAHGDGGDAAKMQNIVVDEIVAQLYKHAPHLLDKLGAVRTKLTVHP